VLGWIEVAARDQDLADWLPSLPATNELSLRLLEREGFRQILRRIVHAAIAKAHRTGTLKTKPTPNRGCFVYWLWAGDGRCLYVGSTRNLRARLQAHRRRWPDQIAHVSYADFGDDERGMLKNEAYAIAEEQPAYNVAGVNA
jgi:hypothetical protein